MFDDEIPAGADGVPVQLIMVGEEADLPIGAISQGVGVVGGHLQEGIIAEIDALAVGLVLDEPRLRLAVAAQALDREINHHGVAIAVPITGRKIAIDAAPNLDAGRMDTDGFGDVEAVVGIDLDVDVVGEDALRTGIGQGCDATLEFLRILDVAEVDADGRLVVLCLRECTRRQQGNETKQQQGNVAFHRRNSTVGAIWLPDSAWKNSESRNPKPRAMSRSGKRWMASL